MDKQPTTADWLYATHISKPHAYAKGQRRLETIGLQE
jgi:hypothetical protein